MNGKRKLAVVLGALTLAVLGQAMDAAALTGAVSSTCIPTPGKPCGPNTSKGISGTGTGGGGTGETGITVITAPVITAPVVTAPIVTAPVAAP